MKYLDTMITFSEFPDEIALCINITNCPFHCPGCHSPELRYDIGTELTFEELDRLINTNEGISLIGFMGGDFDPEFINSLALYVVLKNKGLKVGWYSGRDKIPECIDTDWFDYIKIGPYIKELGGLDSPTTNQKMYHYTGISVDDITHKFWKNGK